MTSPENPINQESADEKFNKLKKFVHETTFAADDPENPEYSGSDQFPWLPHPDKNKEFQKNKAENAELYRD